MSTVVVLRHGVSTATEGDRFAGRADVPLAARGREQAVAAGRALAVRRLVPTAVFSSPLARAHGTAALVAEVSGSSARVVVVDALAERDYGELTGRARSDVRAELGVAGYRAVRRSWTGRPPGGESLAEVARRVMAFWDSQVIVSLAPMDAVVLVVGHGNSLRGPLQRLYGLSDAQAASLEIPFAEPLVRAVAADVARVAGLVHRPSSA